jgi:hypothetical protein
VALLVLDAGVLIAHARGDRAAAAWLTRAADDGVDLAVATPTITEARLAEIFVGSGREIGRTSEASASPRFDADRRTGGLTERLANQLCLGGSLCGRAAGEGNVDIGFDVDAGLLHRTGGHHLPPVSEGGDGAQTLAPRGRRRTARLTKTLTHSRSAERSGLRYVLGSGTSFGQSQCTKLE